MKNSLLYYALLSLLYLLCPLVISAQNEPDSVVVSKYFDSISKDENRLRQFFAQMPKGGDLHNHLTGSVYAETYFRLACQDSLWVNMSTGRLFPDSVPGAIQLKPNMNNLHNIRMTLIDKWSIRNFNPGKFPLGADEYFFGTFGLFGAATKSHYAELLSELRKRAAYENVQYLEIMVSSPSLTVDTYYNEQLRLAMKSDCLSAFRLVLDSICQNIETNYRSLPDSVVKQVNELDSLSLQTKIPNSPVCYYQFAAKRNAEPFSVFAQLYLGYKCCMQANSKVVGVNIVSAENGETSIADYKWHMEMFKYLDSKFERKVKKSLHAGELTLGLVEPEEMSNHISQAVLTACANRIGHGVDIAFETNSIKLLDSMKIRDIPVEINLTSNEFILGVKDDVHPFMLYRQAGVPMVISTDDPGILRTSLTRQYVLATLRYGLCYSDIKKLVLNSIKYSFAPNINELMDKLNKEFTVFEKKWCCNLQIINSWDKP